MMEDLKFSEKTTSQQGVENTDSGQINFVGESIEKILNLDLTWLPNKYRKVTNTSKNDIRIANTQEFGNLMVDNYRVNQLFERLKESGLKIYINDKTDVSYTNKFNIVMGMSEKVTEQSKYSMNLAGTATAHDVHKTKFVHEMCHSIGAFCEEERITLFSYCLAIRKANFKITKLGNLDRYESLQEKAKEDTTEFLRMYVQDPDDFKLYLGKIFDNKDTVNLLFQLTGACINKVI